MEKTPPSPVLSPDFLTNYLAFGPIRRKISKSRELSLPVVIDASLKEYLPPELLAIAEEVREEMQGKPERLIRRKVRDRLDEAKKRRGQMAKAGMKGMKQELKEQFQQVQKKQE